MMPSIHRNKSVFPAGTFSAAILITAAGLSAQERPVDPGFAKPDPIVGAGWSSFSPAPASGVRATAPSLQNLLRSYHRVDVNAAGLLKRVGQLQQGSFALDLGAGLRWDLELERASVRAPGYAVRLVTPEGIKTLPPSPEHVFRGHVRGLPNSVVRLSMSDGRIVGTIDSKDGNAVYIEPLNRFDAGASPSAHAVYFDRDALPVPGLSCGIAESGVDGAPALPKSAEPSAMAACSQVQIAVAAENSMLVGYGSVAAVEKRINDVYLLVDGMYRDPQVDIQVQISEIFVEMQASFTWGTSRDFGSLLNNFKTWARGTSGFKNAWDVGSLWWYERQGGVVGLATLGVVCNRDGNVIKDFTNTIRSQKIDAAHELGHNFSAPHINGNTYLMNPSITGVNDQWDASTISRVVAHKNSRTCMAACSPVPVLPPVGEVMADPYMPQILASGSGHYRVQGLAPQGGNVEILVKTVNGAEIRRKIARGIEAGWFSQDVDLSGLAGGRYLLEIRDVRSQVTRKFVAN